MRGLRGDAVTGADERGGDGGGGGSLVVEQLTLFFEVLCVALK